MKLRDIIKEIKESNIINEKGWFISGWFDVQSFVWGLNEEDDESWIAPTDREGTYLIYTDKSEAFKKAEEAAKTPVGFEGKNNKVKWIYPRGEVSDKYSSSSDQEDILVQPYEGPYDNPPEKTKWIGLKGANVKTKIKEVASQDELKQEIATYKQNSSKIEELQKSVEDVLKEIKAKTSEENQRLKLILKYMDDFGVVKVEGDNWVTSLEETAMYKYPSQSYKELWEAALGKLNDATKKVLKQLENEQLSAKAKMKKKELVIKENVLVQILDWLKGLLNSMKKYKDIVKELPKL